MTMRTYAPCRATLGASNNLNRRSNTVTHTAWKVRIPDIRFLFDCLTDTSLIEPRQCSDHFILPRVKYLARRVFRFLLWIVQAPGRTWIGSIANPTRTAALLS